MDDKMRVIDLFEMILSFSDKCRSLYIYGAGEYGKAMLNFFREHKRNVDGFLETWKSVNSVNGLDVYDARQTISKLDGEDGVIIAISEGNREGVYGINVEIAFKLLCLKDYQLFAISQFDLYDEWLRENDELTISKEYFEIKQRIILDAMEKSRKNLLPLQKKYGFIDWHLYPVETKPYVNDIVEYIMNNTEIHRKNRKLPVVFECGCGLGDIIADDRLSAFRRIGTDIDEKVIKAARELHSGEDIDFVIGGLDCICDQDIDYFITVNFIHGISPEMIKDMLDSIFCNNNIDCYIVDEVTGNYQYYHNITDYLPDAYKLVHTLGPYRASGGKRYIRIYERE